MQTLVPTLAVLIMEEEEPDDYNTEMLKEDQDTKIVVDKIKDFTKDYDINVELEQASYGDNIKLKLKVENVREN